MQISILSGNQPPPAHPGSRAVRIVGTTIDAVRNALAVAAPAGARIGPTTVALFPTRRNVHMAAAGTLPMASHPDVTTAAPAPIALCPGKAAPLMGRGALDAQRRRGDADDDFRLRGRCEDAERRRHDQAKKCFLEVHDSISYVVLVARRASHRPSY